MSDDLRMKLHQVSVEKLLSEKTIAAQIEVRCSAVDFVWELFGVGGRCLCGRCLFLLLDTLSTH